MTFTFLYFDEKNCTASLSPSRQYAHYAETLTTLFCLGSLDATDRGLPYDPAHSPAPSQQEQYTKRSVSMVERKAGFILYSKGDPDAKGVRALSLRKKNFFKALFKLF